MRKHFLAANALQLGFVSISATAQYLMFMDHKREDSIVFSPEKVWLDGKVKTITGVPVGWLGMNRLAFLFVTQVPNYIHVHQTAVVTGASFAAWSPLLQAEFARRWEQVPIVGWMIGSLGMPTLLTSALVWSCISHGASAIVFMTTPLWSHGELAEAAILLFISNFLNAGNPVKQPG